MSSVAQRRGKVPEKAATVLIPEIEQHLDNHLQQQTEEPKKPSTIEIKTAAPPVARVRRNLCGTGPFDRHWLNLDCCGLFCALCTYGLHFYGIYAVCIILLPPWMSYKDDETGERHMTIAGTLHRIVFTSIAVIAIVSHFKAMTTDPGAVPPDAKPLESNDDKSMDDSTQAAKNLLDQPKAPPKVKRLCRRCKAFKPERAHHCSVSILAPVTADIFTRWIHLMPFLCQ